jgi:hypothetical protein
MPSHFTILAILLLRTSSTKLVLHNKNILICTWQAIWTQFTKLPRILPSNYRRPKARWSTAILLQGYNTLHSVRTLTGRHPHSSPKSTRTPSNNSCNRCPICLKMLISSISPPVRAAISPRDTFLSKLSWGSSLLIKCLRARKSSPEPCIQWVLSKKFILNNGCKTKLLINIYSSNRTSSSTVDPREPTSLENIQIPDH